MQQILACIDGTDVTTSVCDHAAWVSSELGAPLQLLHTLERDHHLEAQNLSGSIGLGSRESLLEELTEVDAQRGRLALEHGKLLLRNAAAHIGTAVSPAPETLLRHGALVATLKDLEPQTRVVVIGKHPDHLHEHVGSRLETVIRSIPTPMLICSEDFATPRRVLVAFDGSETTRKVISRLAASPLLTQASISVVMVGDATKDREEHLAWARTQLSAWSEAAEFHIVNGGVEATLLELSEEHDVVVMGAYGHSIVRRFIVGSTTTHLIRHTRKPVLLLR